MIKGSFNLSRLLWAGLGLVVATIYSFVWPHKALTATPGFRFLVIRWGHAIVWLLLTINFLLRGLDSKFNDVVNWIAASGGLIYLLFMVMIFIVK